MMKSRQYLKSAIFVLIALTCLSTQVVAVDGWASMNGGTTGGAGGTTITVTTAANFKLYVESTSAYIVQVSGTIDLGGGVSIKSNKTIIGVDTSSTIIGRLGFSSGASNIIIQGLNISNPSYSEADGISVKNTITNLFITQCTIYDCGDGCLDISNASDYVTVSWCKFYYSNPAPVEDHRFVNLIGSGDDATADRGKLRVTMHHNWWSSRCNQRMPRVRYGQVHVYNNYYGCSGNSYCVGVGVESQIRLESNYFDIVNNPWANYSTAGYTAGIIGWNTGAAGNQFIGTTVPTWAANNYAAVFVPPYPYTLDNGPDVKTIVMAGAGNVVAPDTAPPAAPTNLTAVSVLGQIGLDWDDNVEADLAYYNIYRSITSGAGRELIDQTTESSYVDTDLVEGTTYYYVVTAVDTSENESDASGEIEITACMTIADLDCSGDVDIDDLLYMASVWLTNDTAADIAQPANGIVDMDDFAVLAENWLK